MWCYLWFLIKKHRPPQQERRRRAFLRVLEKYDLRPVDIARRAGFVSPNQIYNFINGHSQSLSIEMYTRIAAVIPGMTVEELTGEPFKKAPPPVLVKTACQGGVLRDQFSLPKTQIKELALPVDDSARLAGAYAAIVRHPGAELIYPADSLLLCIPLIRFDGTVTKGRRLIIERFVDMKIEITVREVQEDAKGDMWLSQRSTEPKLSGSVKLPSEISAKTWRDDHEKYAIAGVVIGAFVPEP